MEPPKKIISSVRKLNFDYLLTISCRYLISIMTPTRHGTYVILNQINEVPCSYMYDKN